uniref:ABC transporter permease n=1 Tax=Bosea sp. NBC_00436 TaxID=2969620 RepID=A0A9E7ZKR5_9HYPH
MSFVSDAGFFGRTIARNRFLLWEMSRRDLFDRYAGQALGGWWTLIHTLSLVGVYLLLFSVFFYPNAKTGGATTVSPTMYILAGMLPWLWAAEVFIRAPGVIRDHAELTRQVVFPTEILPLKITISAFFTTFIGLSLLVIYGLSAGIIHTKSLILLSAALIILGCFLCGAALIASAIGVFLKDIKELMTLYARIGVYAAPVFYFVDMLPERWRSLLYINPMTWFIELFHDALAYGEIRHISVWIGASTMATIACMVGAVLFARLKPQFGSFV